MMNYNSLKSDKNSIIFVSIVGLPNVGKSTLINSFVGAKVSIVSSKPQTTRKIVKGFMNKGNTQIIFVDTPGIFKPKNQYFEHLMMENANIGVICSDLAVVVFDASKEISDEETKSILKISIDIKKIFVINKIDLIDDERLSEFIQKIKKIFCCDKIFSISAKSKVGLKELEKEIIINANEGDWIYGEHEKSDNSVGFHLSEITRQYIFEILDKEIPYSTAVVTDRINSFPNGVLEIYQTIFVKAARHKGILIGKNATIIKKIRILSSKEMKFLFPEKKLSLFLHVKLFESWHNSHHAKELIACSSYDNPSGHFKI